MNPGHDPIATAFEVDAVGVIRSPYREKFAVPRQPGLVTAAAAELILLGDCNRREILRGLEDFSHVWLIFMFHQVLDQGWKPTVRPPRLGGNQRLGVFSTRSPFRPNPIGLSVVELQAIEKRGKQWLLKLGGVDLVDGTPILDIKPYLPYADAIADARGGFTDNQPPTTVAVTFSERSLEQLSTLRDPPADLALLIEQVISQQPQPAYHRQDNRSYGMRLWDFNIRWSNSPTGCRVEAIEQINDR